MTTSLIGYPRIGANRELKFAIEKFFKKELSESELETVAKTQRQLNWQTQFAAGIDFIPSIGIPNNLHITFSVWDDTAHEDITRAIELGLQLYRACDKFTDIIPKKNRCLCVDCAKCQKCYNNKIPYIVCEVH